MVGDESSRFFPSNVNRPGFGGDAGGVRGRRGEKGDGGMERLEDLNGAGVMVSCFGMFAVVKV